MKSTLVTHKKATGKGKPAIGVKPKSRKEKAEAERRSPSPETIARIKASLRATLMSRRKGLRVPMSPEMSVKERQDAFLVEYALDGTISGAAKRAHVSARSHYDWLRSDSFDYVRRFREAHEEMVDIAEKELRRRGVEGYDKPVFYQGEKTAVVREFSDACLIFYLKGRRGDVFKERNEVTGKDGAPLAIQIYVPNNGRPEQPTDVAVATDHSVEGEVLHDQG